MSVWNIYNNRRINIKYMTEIIVLLNQHKNVYYDKKKKKFNQILSKYWNNFSISQYLFFGVFGYLFSF